MLALLLLAMAGQAAYGALQRRREAEAFVTVDGVATLFVKGVGDRAIERGMTNAALNGKDAVAATVRDDIAKRRALADQAFGAGLQRLAPSPRCEMGGPAIAEAERAFAVLQELRERVDEDVAKAPRSAMRTSSRAGSRRSPRSSTRRAGCA